MSERSWGTVREDYSSDGNAWGYFPHDHARSKAFRWGEDGLAGYCEPPRHSEQTLEASELDAHPIDAEQMVESVVRSLGLGIPLHPTPGAA